VFRDDSVVEVERYRPAAGRVTLAAVGVLLMSITGLAVDGPVLIQVIGATFAVALPLFLWVALRTYIPIDASGATMRGARGAVRFTPGDTIVKVTSAPSGLTSVAPVITLRRRSDGRSVTLALQSFSRQMQQTLPERIKRVLRSRPT
jgi:hypothetical protein